MIFPLNNSMIAMKILQKSHPRVRKIPQKNLLRAMKIQLKRQSSSIEDESSEEYSKSDENSAEVSTEESTDDVKSDEEDFGITTIVSLELPAEVLPANITFAEDQTEDDEEAADFQDTADDNEDDDEGSGYYVHYEY